MILSFLVFFLFGVNSVLYCCAAGPDQMLDRPAGMLFDMHCRCARFAHVLDPLSDALSLSGTGRQSVLSVLIPDKNTTPWFGEKVLYPAGFKPVGRDSELWVPCVCHHMVG